MITREKIKLSAILNQIRNEKETSTTANYIDYEKFGFYFTVDELHKFVNSFINQPQLSKKYVLNDWIVYSKGVLPCFETGEYQEDANEEQIRLAEKRLDEYFGGLINQQPQLNDEKVVKEIIKATDVLEKHKNIKSGKYSDELSDDVEEVLNEIKKRIEYSIKHNQVHIGYDRLNILEQHIQTQASEIERLRKLNEGKAKEYFKLLEMYNILDAKLDAFREVFKEDYTPNQVCTEILQILGDSK